LLLNVLLGLERCNLQLGVKDLLLKLVCVNLLLHLFDLSLVDPVVVVHYLDRFH
jgi:hypothetical protein